MTTSAQHRSVSESPVGLLVEDLGGIEAIPQLLRDSGIRLAGPIWFGGQPVQCDDDKLHEFIRYKIVPRVRAMALKRVRLIIVTIDRETRDCCPGEFAQDIAQRIFKIMAEKRSYVGYPPISVVCVDRTLENWIIADPKGILTHNYIVRDLSRAVRAKADGKDALTLLKQAYKPGRHYHKHMDAPKLAAKVRAMQPDVRRRSHSLDKLLRECGVYPLS
jgi:hypothetical protein